MLLGNVRYRSIWLDEDSGKPVIIDQSLLPSQLVTRELSDLHSVCEAIREMRVRGAPLVGATAAFGMAVALSADASDISLSTARTALLETRPTAVNLRWAIDRIFALVASCPPEERASLALDEAQRICEEDVESCKSIGRFGFEVLTALADGRRVPVSASRPLQILTHCNAGWLATVDWGTALAPIYRAHDSGLPVHVWVDETRPRNQGASLTAFELREMGVPHTVIVDNAGGHLMQRGQVDAVIVGSDRTTSTADVCNKIGTYLKALAAKDNGIPFYVALPSSTIDWTISDGLTSIPIEERSTEEVRTISGVTADGRRETVELFDARSPSANPAFDVTPSRLVTSLITDLGIYEATSVALKDLKSLCQ